MIVGKYPSLRLRRSRKSDWSRRLIQENNLTSSDFILPVFLINGRNKKQAIKTMPGVYRYTLDKLIPFIEKAIKKLSTHINGFEDKLTGLIKISSTFQDPLLAAAVANFISIQVTYKLSTVFKVPFYICLSH